VKVLWLRSPEPHVYDSAVHDFGRYCSITGQAARERNPNIEIEAMISKLHSPRRKESARRQSLSLSGVQIDRAVRVRGLIDALVARGLEFTKCQRLGGSGSP
jgi:hypothetical protein